MDLACASSATTVSSTTACALTAEQNVLQANAATLKTDWASLATALTSTPPTSTTATVMAINAVQLSNLEARVAELAMINLESIPRDTVGLGSKVELEDLDEGGCVEYEIVVPEEVDGAQNKISLSSPLGRALIGKSCDDDIEVQTPRGKRAYLVRRLVTLHELIAAENGQRQP